MSILLAARGVKPRTALGAVVIAVSFGSAPANAEVEQKLRDALSASSPKVRIVAVAEVAATKDRGARALLEPLLADADAAVRASVIDALGNIGDPAALTALAEVADDHDKTVQTVLLRVLPALQAARVPVFVGAGEDFSGATQPLAADLRQKTRRALTRILGAGFLLHEDPTKKSFGAAPIAVRSVVLRVAGEATFVDVKCEITVVEMPGNTLRAALSTTASVGVEGAVNRELEAELARDAIAACAPALASDFASYVKERSRR